MVAVQIYDLNLIVKISSEFLKRYVESHDPVELMKLQCTLHLTAITPGHLSAPLNEPSWNFRQPGFSFLETSRQRYINHGIVAIGGEK